MAKDRSESEKREKKEKKHRLSETNGVTKDKSDKEEKKRAKKAAKAAAALESAASPQADAGANGVDEDGDVVIEDAVDKVETDDDKEKVKKQLLLLSAVPFANPMADDKTMRRVLRGVKKGNNVLITRY